MDVVTRIIGEAFSRRTFLKMLGIGAGSVAAPWSAISKELVKIAPALFTVNKAGIMVPVTSIPANAIKTRLGYVVPMNLQGLKGGLETTYSIYDKSNPAVMKFAEEASAMTNVLGPIQKGLADGTLTWQQVSKSPHMDTLKKMVIPFRDEFRNNFYSNVSGTFKSPEVIKRIYGVDANIVGNSLTSEQRTALQRFINVAIDQGADVCPEVVNLVHPYEQNIVQHLRTSLKKQTGTSVDTGKGQKLLKDMEDLEAKHQSAAQAADTHRHQAQRDQAERWNITRNYDANKTASRTPRMDWAGGSEDTDYNAYSLASESKRAIDVVVGSSN